jgi:hypothetical protein
MTHVENVESVIAQIEAINEGDDYAYEKILLSLTKVKKLPIFIDTFGAGTKLFRTRTHTTNTLFSNISELKNPDKTYVSKFARCNRPFQSVFYGSENRPVSYLELVEHWAETADFGSRFYASIGCWETTQDINVILVLNTDTTKRFTQFEKYHGGSLDKVLETQEPELKVSSSLFLNYLDSKFSKPAKRDLKTYMLTTAYSNLSLLHSKENAQGIAYQSVPAAKMGINIAIQSDFVDKLKLVHVLRNGFETFKNDKGKHSFIEFESVESKQIKNDKGTIEW